MRPQRGKEPVKNRAASAKKVFCVFLAVWLAVIAFLAAAGNGELLAARVFILGVPFMGFIGVICSVAAMPQGDEVKDAAKDPAQTDDADCRGADHSNDNRDGVGVGFWLSLIAMLAGGWFLYSIISGWPIM